MPIACGSRFKPVLSNSCSLTFCKLRSRFAGFGTFIAVLSPSPSLTEVKLSSPSLAEGIPPAAWAVEVVVVVDDVIDVVAFDNVRVGSGFPLPSVVTVMVMIDN